MIPTSRGPLRVAMVSACALPLMGGIETHVHEVSTRLGAAGVDVTVLTTDRSGNLPVEEELPGYRVRRFPAYPRSRELYLAPGLARHLLANQRLRRCPPTGSAHAGRPGGTSRSATSRHPDRADDPHRASPVSTAKFNTPPAAGGCWRR